MLQQVRDFTQRRTVRVLIMVFLVVVFGLFGLESYTNRGDAGSAIATVGNHRITQPEFDNAIRVQADRYREQFGANFDATIMDNPEIRRSVLDRLVAERLIAIGAQSAGVRVGDAALAARIAAEPSFHDPNGQFSRQRYDDIAKANNLTPVGLDERLREDFRLEAFRQSITDTAIVPRATLDGFIRLSEQSREVSVVNLPLEPFLLQVKVTPEEVKSYYEANPAQFTLPEQVRAEFLELSVDTLAAQAPVEPDAVKAFYDANMSRWGQLEQRRASHVLLNLKADAPDAEKKATQARAEAIAAQVRKAPASFAEVAKKESQDLGSAVQGGDLGFFPSGAMVKVFEEAAFAAKKGDIVGPVLSEFGWHVIQLTDIKPAQLRSLAEATPEIEAELKKLAASQRFAEVADQFTNVVYEQPTSLKPAADLLKLTVQPTGWFSKTGGAPPQVANPKLLGDLFADDAIKGKRNTSAVEVRPSVLVSARVLEHKPAELRPLEAVQAEIQRRLVREAAAKLAKADGDAKLKALQEGKDASLTWPAPLAVNRQRPGGLMPQVIDEVFRSDAKTLPAYVGVETPSGFMLARVSKVIDVGAIDDAKREGLGTQLRSAVAAQDLEATLASIRNKAGIQVRAEAIEKREEGPAGTPVPAKPSRPSRFGNMFGGS